ncbi:excitatory amino acid transporter 3-like [Cebidichthys violaceus]|uniref:excitatory amino acid transporter 3-like n=1 Tax=Cebidichthys violaceus TaxID=271503 RepID=UPI0035CB44E0
MKILPWKRSMGKEGELLVDIVLCFNKAVKHLIKAIIGFLPIGLFFITSVDVVEVVYDFEALVQIGMFMGVVVVGLCIHGAVVQPLIYLLCEAQPLTCHSEGFSCHDEGHAHLTQFVSFRDRCNAAVNVMGDCVGVSLVHHLSGKELEEMNGEQGFL